MNDTAPEIEALFNQMMMKKSGQERMMMGFSMFDLARKQVEARIRADKPNANGQEIRREIFLCFYGHEFSPEGRDKILKQIL